MCDVCVCVCMLIIISTNKILCLMKTLINAIIINYHVLRVMSVWWFAVGRGLDERLPAGRLAEQDGAQK